VAQIGAAIGREFSYELLAAVASMDENELREALTRLCDSGLVFCRGRPPEATYTFKHALVQDAAGSLLLRGRRQQLHARIASTLEERFPDTAGAVPELLAHHWAEAGTPSRAVELWAEAGERALARAANREASGFFERALAALVATDETPELLARVVDLRRSLYNATYKFGELHRTHANLTEAERLAARLNDSTRLCRILVDMTYILGCTGDIAGAIASGERAAASADRGEDLEARVQSRIQLARSLYAKGRYREAIDHIRDVIGMLGEDVTRGQLGPGLNQTISARVWLVLFHAELGEFTVCAAEAAEARRLAEQAEGAWGAEGQVWLRLALGRAAVLRGEFTEAVEALEPALAPCESEFAIYFSRVASSLGIARARLGDPGRGLALLREAVRRDRAIGFGFRFGLLLAQLGEALLLAGDADGALDAGTQALEAARTSGEDASEAWALHLLGDVAARRGRPRAAASYREALNIAERLAIAPLRARCLEGLSRLAGARSATAR
jgi:tetratricopeptide (TPR) repeat protein